jgi:hypothetical protein
VYICGKYDKIQTVYIREREQFSSSDLLSCDRHVR